MGDLSPSAVLPRLRGRFGRPYTFLDECASTQEAIPPAAAEGAVVAADVQTAGRGRLGRTWEAPPGTSLLFSVVLTPQVRPERLPGSDARRRRAPSRTRSTCRRRSSTRTTSSSRGRKLAGILGEARDGRVVLGIGINVNVPAGAPAEDRGHAADVAAPRDGRAARPWRPAGRRARRARAALRRVASGGVASGCGCRRRRWRRPSRASPPR